MKLGEVDLKVVEIRDLVLFDFGWVKDFYLMKVHVVPRNFSEMNFIKIEDNFLLLWEHMTKKVVQGIRLLLDDTV